MRPMRWIMAAVLPLALFTAAGVADAQGKGQGKGNEKKDVVKPERQNRADTRGRGSMQRLDDDKRGRGQLQRADDDRGRAVARGDDKGKDKDARVVITESGGTVIAPTFRDFIVSERKGQRIAGLAVARAARRGVSDDAFVITPVGERVQVLNRNGVVLVDWDDDRELGNWTVVTTPFQDKRGSPSFCRSGAGHPVWGRQWCIDRGFGLGQDGDVRWARVLDPSNVIVTRPTTGDLTR